MVKFFFHAAFVVLFTLTVKAAFAIEVTNDPALAEFYTKLKQPDNGSPCCGIGDAYFADQVETNDAGQLVAIITDTRPDDRVVNGVTIHRAHIDVGTKFVVPESKRRKVIHIPNVTGHNIIFVGSPSEYDMGPTNSGHIVYCWEPAAEG